MGLLEGFLFDGRCSCIEDSFAGNLSLYCGNFLQVSIYVKQSMVFKWERDFLSNGVCILIMAYLRYLWCILCYSNGMLGV